jgi:hypothetical protein
MSAQHHIPDPPPITDAMSQHATGTSFHDLLGETVTVVYNVPDSDRDEVLLQTESDRTFLVSCDPSVYGDEFAWQTCIYDATDTEAGKVMRTLAPGEWL